MRLEGTKGLILYLTSRSLNVALNSVRAGEGRTGFEISVEVSMGSEEVSMGEEGRGHARVGKAKERGDMSNETRAAMRRALLAIAVSATWMVGNAWVCPAHMVVAGEGCRGEGEAE